MSRFDSGARHTHKESMMLTTHELIGYMIKRRVGESDIIIAAPDDPVLLQAQQDGYADWRDGQWHGRGSIQRGEARTVRFTEGGVRTIVGR